MHISIDDIKALVALAKTAKITAGEGEAVGQCIARIELAIAFKAVQDATALAPQTPADQKVSMVPAPVADPPQS